MTHKDLIIEKRVRLKHRQTGQLTVKLSTNSPPPTASHEIGVDEVSKSLSNYDELEVQHGADEFYLDNSDYTLGTPMSTSSDIDALGSCTTIDTLDFPTLTSVTQCNREEQVDSSNNTNEQCEVYNEVDEDPRIQRVTKGLIRLLKAHRLVRRYDILRSNLASMEAEIIDFKISKVSWGRIETQVFDCYDPTASILKTGPAMKSDVSILRASSSKSTEDKQGSGPLEFSPFSFHFKNEKVLSSGIGKKVSRLLNQDRESLYADMCYLFGAALEQVKLSIHNFAELVKMICDGAKKVSAISSRILASQLRFTQIEDYLAKRSANGPTSNSFNVEKETLLCVVQNDGIQNDLMSIKDYLQDLVAFLLKHLNSLFCEVLDSMSLNELLENLHDNFTDCMGDSSDCPLPFPCYSRYTSYIDFIVENGKLISDFDFQKALENLTFYHGKLEELGNEMLKSSQELLHDTLSCQ